MTRLFGGLLLGPGILIMACSSLCLLVVVVIDFPAAIQPPAMILVSHVAGGLPFAFGFGLSRAGRLCVAMHRRRTTSVRNRTSYSVLPLAGLAINR